MRYTGRVNKTMIGMVAKKKVGELEEEVREGFIRHKRKNLNEAVEAIIGKKGYLARYQYIFKKDLI